jgi:glucose/arabinose dehydrogenase
MRVRQLLTMVLVLSGCGGMRGSGERSGAFPPPACDPGNGGIALPEGFCAVVVADVVAPRHLAVARNGDLFVSSRGRPNATDPTERGGVFALRDTTGDGKADVRGFFGPEGGTGLRFHDGDLYFATNTAVLRYELEGELVPAGKPDTIVRDLPGPPGHVSKSIAFDDDRLFVDIGSPGNACQPLDQERQAGVRGEDPCTQLETRSGVWLFDAEEQHQTLAQGKRWATGIRNAVAFAWNPRVEALYAVQHGREQLAGWPGFTAQDDDVRVAEELQRVDEGSDFGWPYCYFDLLANERVLAPEYGGDGRQVGRCADASNPMLTFPPHSAPNDLLFYTGAQFPARYRGGAFLAFHGKGSPAAPGYRVAFVPFAGRSPAGNPETFAGGFAGADPAAPAHRPMGLAEGPDGSLYIADSRAGRIWRVMYTGVDRATAE